jgi:WD40 repeat protein
MAVVHFTVLNLRLKRSLQIWPSIACLLLVASSLSAQQPTASRTLVAESAPVHVTFSPDGKTLASAGIREPDGPGELKLWDVATGKNVATWSTHPGKIWTLAWSPDGKTLASAGGFVAREMKLEAKPVTGEVSLWDVATGKVTGTLRGFPGPVWSVAFSPDGKTLAASGQDGTTRLWEVATGKSIATFRADTTLFDANMTMPGSVAFSPDGKTLAVGGGPVKGPPGSGVTGEIRLWDLATGKHTATFQGHPGEGCFSNMFAAAFAVAFSPDGKTLVSGGARTVELWDVATGKRIMTAQGVGGAVVWRVAFSPDGKTVASASEVPRPGSDVKQPTQNEIRLLEVPTGKPIASFKGHDKMVWTLAFSPDGETLASAGADGTIKLWNVAQLRAAKPATPRPENDPAIQGPGTASPGRDQAGEELDRLQGRWRFVMPEGLANKPADDEGRRFRQWAVDHVTVTIEGNAVTVVERGGEATPLLRGRLKLIPGATPMVTDLTIDSYLPEVQFPDLTPKDMRLTGRTLRLYYSLERDLLRCQVVEPGKEAPKDPSGLPEVLRRDARRVPGEVWRSGGRAGA